MGDLCVWYMRMCPLQGSKVLGMGRERSSVLKIAQQSVAAALAVICLHQHGGGSRPIRHARRHRLQGGRQGSRPRRTLCSPARRRSVHSEYHCTPSQRPVGGCNMQTCDFLPLHAAPYALAAHVLRAAC